MRDRDPGFEFSLSHKDFSVERIEPGIMFDCGGDRLDQDPPDILVAVFFEVALMRDIAGFPESGSKPGIGNQFPHRGEAGDRADFRNQKER